MVNFYNIIIAVLIGCAVTAALTFILAIERPAREDRLAAVWRR